MSFVHGQLAGNERREVVVARGRVPAVQVMEYGPGTALVGVTVVVQFALPVTPPVASISPFLKPLMVAVSAGLASP